LCIKFVNCEDDTEMHGQQNITIQEELCCLSCLVITMCDAFCRMTADPRCTGF